MSTPARTPSAGMPAWPARPAPPTVPATVPSTRAASAPAAHARPAGARPATRPGPAHAAPRPAPVAPAAPATRVDTPPPAAPSEAPAGPTTPVPTAEERALDPRTIARASLAAGRNRSLWWTLGGIAAAVAGAFVWDALVGVVALATLLLVYAGVRAVGPSPGPAAVTVRSKALDVALLALSGVALLVLVAVVPTS